MKLVVSVSVGIATVWLASLAACTASSDSGGTGGAGGYGTGGGTTGGSGGMATGGAGGSMGGSTSGGAGGASSGGGGGSGGSTACPLQIQGVSQACADCITGKCCNEFVACGQDTTCNTFNTCVVQNNPDCSAATDAAGLKTCLTTPCPTTDAAYQLWGTAQACAAQSCSTECQ
ncbi:MAG: hypothetical protein HS104_32440 [Polyangiaceae bacterium]|nr:hypothetical protein [Polyangiaceae bacterium]MBK8997744.1 hypothetical protein [Myxococcales bacterium]